MDIVQNLTSMTGWPGLILMILSVVFGGIYISRRERANADALRQKADKETIESFQRQVNAMRDEIRYLREALKQMGVEVTMDGRILHIHNKQKEEG